MDLVNGRIGVIDLGTHQSSEQELSDVVMYKTPSSLQISESLISEHGSGSLVLGTGILTGTLLPAACAGIVRSGRKVSPLLGFAGVELKLTGFDFVVVKGSAAEPSYLWIRDGIIELVPSPSLRGTESWARTDRIRADQGDRRIQVVSIGPWGDSMNPRSQYVVNYWGGEDKQGLAADIGSKNLVAIAFRGMGELPVSDSEAYFAQATSIFMEHHARLGDSRGLESYSQAAMQEDFRNMLHRNLACFACPYPCRSYLKLFEDPKQMAHLHQEPGYLHYDIPSLSKANSLGLGARDATAVLTLCAKNGAEPVSVLSHAQSIGLTGLDGVRKVLADPAGMKSPSGADYAGGFEDQSSAHASFYECIGRGLCPRYWAKLGLPLPHLGI